MLKPIEWTGQAARIIDQTLLPSSLVYEDITTVEAMYEAIRILKVRGAPLIGISAAYGVCLGVAACPRGCGVEALLAAVNASAQRLAAARPTAVNLFWALDRIQARARDLAVAGDETALRDGLLNEAREVFEEDCRMCRAIGENGYQVLKDFSSVHTHCNAGGLATSGLGTALAPVYIGLEHGKRFHVFVDETRPLLQGARITAFELTRAGVPATLICDNMAAVVMAQGKVDAVIVGADRIASNGDTANKVGTYGLAVIARHHGVPFFVAAPSSTLDRSIVDGSLIPIEQRDAAEITAGMGRRTAPEGVDVFNPAFDVTPHELISAIITETGIHRPPFCFGQSGV